MTYRKRREVQLSDSDSDDIDDKQVNYLESKWEFPNLIGSYNEYSVPALEFTKMVCQHIFGLEPAFQQQAQTLMSNMLTLLKIKEFALEVVNGKEPSFTLVVPDVICSNC